MSLPLKRIVHVVLLAGIATPLAGAHAAPAHHSADLGTRSSTITLPNGSQYTLQTPADLHVSLYATGLSSARFMALGPRDDVFVGSWYAGTVSVLLNRKGGTQATQVVTLLSGLTVPHSVVYRNGLLYVGEEGQVSSWGYDSSAVTVSNQRVIVSGLPVGGRHVTRTVVIGPDRRLYVSVGSSCNECVDYADRAVIMRYRLDGTGGQVYARGLRNAVGLAFQPGTGRLWAVDNGQDLLGDNAPPDELDLIKQGGTTVGPTAAATDSGIRPSPPLPATARTPLTQWSRYKHTLPRSA